MARKFIKRAIKRPGALRAKARAAGALNPDGTIKRSWIMKKARMKAATAVQKRTKRQARFAITLSKLRKRK